MKKLFVTLLAFTILTIYHYDVIGTGSFRRPDLKKLIIKEELVSWGDNGIYLHKHDVKGWYKFVPYGRIVIVEKEEK